MGIKIFGSSIEGEKRLLDGGLGNSKVLYRLRGLLSNLPGRLIDLMILVEAGDKQSKEDESETKLDRERIDTENIDAEHIEEWEKNGGENTAKYHYRVLELIQVAYEFHQALAHFVHICLRASILERKQSHSASLEVTL